MKINQLYDVFLNQNTSVVLIITSKFSLYIKSVKTNWEKKHMIWKMYFSIENSSFECYLMNKSITKYLRSLLQTWIIRKPGFEFKKVTEMCHSAHPYCLVINSFNSHNTILNLSLKKSFFN